MSHIQSPEMRDLVEPGWREREAEKERAFADFYSSLPARYPRHGIAAAQIVSRLGAERIEPVIVVDFYREHGQP